MSSPYQDPYNQPFVAVNEGIVSSKRVPPVGPEVPVPPPGPAPPLMPIPGTSGPPTTGGYPRQSSDPSPYPQSPPSYQEATQYNANNTGGHPYYATPTTTATPAQPIAAYSPPPTTSTQPMPEAIGYNVGYQTQTYGTMYPAQQPPPPPSASPSGPPANYYGNPQTQTPYNPYQSSPPNTQTNYNYSVNYTYNHYHQPVPPPPAPPSQTTTNQNYSPQPPSQVPNYSIPTTNYNYTVPTTYNVTMPYEQSTNPGQYSPYPQATAHSQPQPVAYPDVNNSGDGSAAQQPQTFQTPAVTDVQPPYGYS